MLKIGLTGGIGSGKSTAADFFRSRNIEVIDLDQLARVVVARDTPALKEISNRFGREVLFPGGELKRQKLAEIVFADTAEKSWLESLLHPLIESEKERILAGSQSAYVVIEIPLLVENRLWNTVDRVLLIDCDEKLQLTRAKLRGLQTEGQINKIIALQAARQDRKAVADDTAANDGTEQELRGQLEVFHQKYIELAGDASQGSAGPDHSWR